MVCRLSYKKCPQIEHTQGLILFSFTGAKKIMAKFCTWINRPVKPFLFCHLVVHTYNRDWGNDTHRLNPGSQVRWALIETSVLDEMFLALGAHGATVIPVEVVQVRGVVVGFCAGVCSTACIFTPGSTLERREGSLYAVKPCSDEGNNWISQHPPRSIGCPWMFVFITWR